MRHDMQVWEPADRSPTALLSIPLALLMLSLSRIVSSWSGGLAKFFMILPLLVVLGHLFHQIHLRLSHIKQLVSKARLSWGVSVSLHRLFEQRCGGLVALLVDEASLWLVGAVFGLGWLMDLGFLCAQSRVAPCLPSDACLVEPYDYSSWILFAKSIQVTAGIFLMTQFLAVSYVKDRVVQAICQGVRGSAGYRQLVSMWREVGRDLRALRVRVEQGEQGSVAHVCRKLERLLGEPLSLTVSDLNLPLPGVQFSALMLNDLLVMGRSPRRQAKLAGIQDLVDRLQSLPAEAP